jgi:pimeloyl-ACP methyl ester carboxylesterase
MTASVKSFVWQGRRLAYREAGTPGRGLLLLLPGSTASSASLAGELAYFGRKHHVVALDFLGTGGSERIAPWPASWWEFGAEQATALAGSLGAGRYAVMGVSGGGVAALLTALQAPGEVAAVVADSCVDRLTPEDLERIVHGRDPDTSGMAAAREGPNAEAGDLILGRGVLSLGRRLANRRLAAFWETAHGRDWQDVVAADSALLLGLATSGGWDPLGGRLGDVCCPVLLTGSSADETLPGLDARQAEMAARLPSCRRAFFTGGGHPAMWTCAREFRRAADAFLAAIDF